MAINSKLVVQLRTETGTPAARRSRHKGITPGVLLLEGGVSSPVKFVRHDLDMLLRRHRSETMMLDVEIEGGASKKFLLKEVQRDAIDGGILHVDFQEIVSTRKLRVHVPLRLVGEPVGVTQGGGVLGQHLRALEVECLPADLPEEIQVDVAGLNVDQSIQVRELKIDPKLHVLTAGDISVTSVVVPKIEEEVPAEAEAVGEAGAEPEVIGKRKPEEGEEEAEAEGGKPEAGAKGAPGAKGAAPAGKGAAPAAKGAPGAKGAAPAAKGAPAGKPGAKEAAPKGKGAAPAGPAKK